jgi:hypothetical protein
MLDLRDSDLVLLAQEILEKKVCIKNNAAYRDRLTVVQGEEAGPHHHERAHVEA